MIVEFYDEHGKEINDNPWIKSDNPDFLILMTKIKKFNMIFLFESNGYKFYSKIIKDLDNGKHFFRYYRVK